MLEASFNIDESHGVKCAESARLWENLLNTYREPFIILRVADLRYVLQSNKSMALELYEELVPIVHDTDFTQWVQNLRASNIRLSNEALYLYKTSPQPGFSPSQRWRNSTAQDPFPYCRLRYGYAADLREMWNAQGSNGLLRTEYLNLHCIETNEIEGTFALDLSATTKLVQVGFFQQALPITDRNITGGEVRTTEEALRVLRDTRNALDLIFDLFKTSSTTSLTTDLICRLHKILMTSSQVMYTSSRYGHRTVYTAIGVTRSTSRANVSASIIQNNIQVKTQFCPFDEVDGQLQTFCTRFNELVQQPDIDPFAAAAWISHVFITIHPFEDGNGRLSRILASIPLLKNNLPPLSIPPSFKQQYILASNFVRANRDGDYKPLMDALYFATHNSWSNLKLLVANV